MYKKGGRGRISEALMQLCTKLMSSHKTMLCRSISVSSNQ